MAKSIIAVPATVQPAVLAGGIVENKDQAKSIPVVKPTDLFVKGRVSGLGGE